MVNPTDRDKLPVTGSNTAGPNITPPVAAPVEPIDEVPSLCFSPNDEDKANAETAPALQAEAAPTPKRRGFAAMDRTLVRELARRGGAAAHAAGKAHRFTTQEAREAGRKGGRAPHQRAQTPSTPTTSK